ncbi:MAG: TetR/AcrR family transcriptional regulator [Clostridiales Family XIII bacterium]|jgi:AcrR family transcriptional regulator|nr:TetR/AcrR family transcriptional regulator [Clostridiales Family XIII bacterium]
MSDKTNKRDTIIDCALELFSMKGYAETSIRDIARMAGVRGSSIYSHFPSKQAILDEIISTYSNTIPDADELWSIEKFRQAEGPVEDKLFACLFLSYPKGQEERYIKMLSVFFQEHARNDTVQKYFINEYIEKNESVLRKIAQDLQTAGLIEPVDSELFAKLFFSVLHYYSSRNISGLYDTVDHRNGAHMYELLRLVIQLMIKPVE